MLTSLLTYLLISNALSLRKDKSILFSRIVMVSLILTNILAFNNLFLISLDKGIVVYTDLFNVTAFTQSFNIFIYTISPLLALLLSLTLLLPSELHIVAVYFLVYGNSTIIMIKAFINIIYLIFMLCSFDFMSLFIDYYYLEHNLDLGTLNSEGTSGENSTDKPANSNSDNSNEGGKGKKPKPNLHIKVGAQSDLEKDTEKVGNCFHEDMSLFMANTSQDVEGTMCDFSDVFDSKGKVETHKAFDSATDVAFVCNNCHAVMCKDCGEDYSSSENASPDK